MLPRICPWVKRTAERKEPSEAEYKLYVYDGPRAGEPAVKWRVQR